MRTVDAIVVGGGPAGSTCARKLVQAGVDVLVLDRAAFPRTKLCAGWVTPEALQDLDIEPADYPRGLLTFERLRVHWKFVSLAPATRQFSVRRYEFDDFLLRHSGAEVLQHKVGGIRADGSDWIVDDRFRCRYLVGAGGTACPVYRQVFSATSPRNPALQTATLEQEFACDWRDPDCHLWFFDGGLPGYAWYVPKAGGFVNVGLGAMAQALKARGGHLREHWARFVDRLKREDLVDYAEFRPGGYSYYLRGAAGTVRIGNAFLAGDAAGLATVDMCEGIGPAIRSGRLVAEAITGGGEYSLDSIGRLSGTGLASRLLERRFTAAT